MKGKLIHVHTVGHTCHFNSKCSPLKLLCTLARLCKGTPLQLLRLDFFGIDFPLHPCSQLLFLNFCGQDNRTRGKARRAHERALLPNLPTPRDIARPPNYHLSPAKVSARCEISHRRVPLEEFSPCVLRNHFSVNSPCSSFAIASTGEGGEED